MAKDLPKGTKLKSRLGVDIVVEQKLGEGGQGYVYKVIYGGMPKALKIYKPGKKQEILPSSLPPSVLP